VLLALGAVRGDSAYVVAGSEGSRDGVSAMLVT
jgi:hypothetical protein